MALVEAGMQYIAAVWGWRWSSSSSAGSSGITIMALVEAETQDLTDTVSSFLITAGVTAAIRGQGYFYGIHPF